MKQGMLIVISGPSAVGKGTICKALLQKNPELQLSISATTRLPRENEINGQSYFFMSKDDFLNKIESEEFLEYAEVYGNYYGTPKKPVFDKINLGYKVLLEIDIQGAMKVQKICPNAVFVFILPPSLQELRNRIKGRATESLEEIERRMRSSQGEIEEVINYNYAVINDNVEDAVEKIRAIIIAEQNSVKRNDYRYIYEEVAK